MAAPNTFEGARLDRVTMRRRDPEWVAAQLADASSRAVVAGDAAVLVDPLDVDAIATALSRVLTDPGDLRERGRARAAEFSWERTARETRALLYGIARTRS